MSNVCLHIKFLFLLSHDKTRLESEASNVSVYLSVFLAWNAQTLLYIITVLFECDEQTELVSYEHMKEDYSIIIYYGLCVYVLVVVIHMNVLVRVRSCFLAFVRVVVAEMRI